ncbi:zinc finger, CCHC-type containing protein [Tanacetum coccineum]
MDAAAMKHMASDFAKLDKFEGVNFRRWHKKMQFLLSSMSVVYVLTTPILEDGGNDATVEQIRKRAKFTQHKINMDEAIQVFCIIDKLPPSWKDFKHKKQELNLVELDSHLRIEESLKAQDSDKSKGNNVVGPQKNLVLSGILNNYGYKQETESESDKFVLSKHAFMSTSKQNDSILWHDRLGHVHFKRMQDMSKDGLIPAFDMNTKKAVVRLLDPKLKTLSERGIDCIFVGYAEHYKAFRFSLVPRPSLRIPNGTEDIGGLVVPKEFAGGEVGGAEGFGGGEFGAKATMGGDGIGGDEGVVKAKSSGVICERLSLDVIEEEHDVPLVDGVLNCALGAFGDRGLCFGDGDLASSCVRCSDNCLGGIIVIFGFLVALELSGRGKLDNGWVKKNCNKHEETEYYFEKYLHHVSLRHHQIDEKKIRDGRRRIRK